MDWLGSDVDRLWAVGASAVLLYLSLVALTRWVGVRSFSEISTFDIAVTLAVGAIVASTVISGGASLLDGLLALTVLNLLQLSVGWLRSRFAGVRRWLDNRPVLLIAHGEIVQENLRRVRVSEDDLTVRLRAANVHRLAQVRAAIMEPTGNISILTGFDDLLEPALYERVIGAARLMRHEGRADLDGPPADQGTGRAVQRASARR